MGVYRLKVKCNNSQVEVIAKNGALLSRELDRYLAIFVNGKLVPSLAQKTSHQDSCTTKPAQIPAGVLVQNQQIQTPIKTQSPKPSEPVVNKPQEQVPWSLKEFIALNESFGAYEEFIVSAYYIKNVLKEDSFTLKSLNAGLYPATGTLINLSLVEEIKNQGLLNSFEDNGSVRYSLSEQGEAYFYNRLRGQ